MKDTPIYSVELLCKALFMACERIADSDQTYEEANTPEGWMDHYLNTASKA